MRLFCVAVVVLLLGVAYAQTSASNTERDFAGNNVRAPRSNNAAAQGYGDLGTNNQRLYKPCNLNAICQLSVVHAVFKKNIKHINNTSPGFVQEVCNAVTTRDHCYYKCLDLNTIDSSGHAVPLVHYALVYCNRTSDKADIDKEQAAKTDKSKGDEYDESLSSCAERVCEMAGYPEFAHIAPMDYGSIEQPLPQRSLLTKKYPAALTGPAVLPRKTGRWVWVEGDRKIRGHHHGKPVTPFMAPSESDLDASLSVEGSPDAPPSQPPTEVAENVNAPEAAVEAQNVVASAVNATAAAVDAAPAVAASAETAEPVPVGPARLHAPSRF